MAASAVSAVLLAWLPVAVHREASIWRGLLASLVALAATGCASVSTPGAAGAGPVGDVAYANEAAGWTISYPRGWTIDAADPGFVMLRGENPPALIGIRVFLADESRSLESVVDLVLASLPPEQFRLVSRRIVTLPAGYQAIEIVHHVGAGTLGKSRKVFTIAKGRGFVIDAETFLDSWAAAEPSFNRVIDSFRVRD